MSDELPVMEEFFTIQGEGKYTGTPAYFIRLGGCDVGCVWCDVKESWDVEMHPKHKVSDIINRVNHGAADLVVITGGEPAMYDLTELCKGLTSIGKTITIETSGCYQLKGALNWYTFSPKKFKKPIKEAYEKAPAAPARQPPPLRCDGASHALTACPWRARPADPSACPSARQSWSSRCAHSS